MIDPTAGLLLLADSRFPGGGHAHSGGVEAVVDRGLLRDAGELGVFLDGRVAGAGTVVAAVAAAGCLLAERAEPVDWARWDAAVSARTPSAALREASRVQGSALLRTARRVWQAAALEALARHGRPHHPLALGAAVAAGAGPARWPPRGAGPARRRRSRCTTFSAARAPPRCGCSAWTRSRWRPCRRRQPGGRSR